MKAAATGTDSITRLLAYYSLAQLLVRRTLWFRLRWVLNLSLRATVSVCLFLFSCFFARAERRALSALSTQL